MTGFALRGPHRRSQARECRTSASSLRWLRLRAPFDFAVSRSSKEPDEAGAILILALVFILVISLSVLALLTFGGTGIKNAANLQGQRSMEYAADGATSAAIQSVRYSYRAYDGTTNPAGSCLPSGTMTIPEDGIPYQMTVDCVGTLEVAPAPQQFTRIVNFYACNQSACSQSNATVAATVEFQDLSSATGVDDCFDDADTGTCGTAMVISAWIVKNASN